MTRFEFTSFYASVAEQELTCASLGYSRFFSASLEKQTSLPFLATRGVPHVE